MVRPRVVLSTLRHLRLRQVSHQLLRRLWRRSARPFPLDWRSLPPRDGNLKNTGRVYFDGKDGFNFNNQPGRFAGNWNPPGMRKLWIYNLHYMAWLFDLETGREEWIVRWIRENPPQAGNGWEPYPVSLRLFNWCKHYAVSGASPAPEVLASISLQAGWVAANLEFHIDGNHLLENLLALQYAAFFLDQGDARGAAMEARINLLLADELKDQFLEDGGHCELSPMYHAILLERLLDLLNVWPAERPAWAPLHDLVVKTARAGLDWLEAMSVGGRFALFNDACYDSAPESGRLLAFGARLLSWKALAPVPLRSLRETGYHRAEAGPFTVIFDTGRLGPNHQMGHAQGDMLSLCMWLSGRPILVHPGNFEYQPGMMRDYCRSTAAHNTVSVDGCEQAEWWASHRVGRRGCTLDVTAHVDSGNGAVLMAGSHDGFKRVSGGPLHRRELALTSSSLMVKDNISAPVGRIIKAYYHFHPDCALERLGDGILIRTDSGNLLMWADHPMRVVEAWHCPEFGLRIRNWAVIVEGSGVELHCGFAPHL